MDTRTKTIKPVEVVSRIRRPAVAGYFYPASAELLREALDSTISYHGDALPARAVIVPHGSLAHCGQVLSSVLSRTLIPKRCVIIGPSHTGSWMPWSLMARGCYRTPLGDVTIDEALCDALRQRCDFLESDSWAQQGEHSIEAVLPFIQHHGPANLSIVPIVVGSQDAAEISQLAQALAQVVRMIEEPVLLIASANFSHYEPQTVVMEQDRILLEQVSRFDGEALMRQVKEAGIRMCADNAVSAVLSASRLLGAAQVEVVDYATSAQAGGDPDSAIGFAGVRII